MTTPQRTSSLAAALLAALLLTACPEAVQQEPPVADGGLEDAASSEDATSSGQDAKLPDPADVAPDVSAPDAAPDVAPDVADPCGVCCPGERVCVSPESAGVCNPDGDSVTAQPCEAGEVCQGGVCGPPPFSCTPGASMCLDSVTLETCNARGDAVTTRTCPDGLCIAGACTTGASTGEACEADADCAGGECLCRGAEQCTGSVATAWAAGYCTAADCGATGCAAGESCVDFNVSGVAGGGRHCVKDCMGCNNTPGLTCAELPVVAGARRIWEPVCFPEGLKDFAAFCAQGSECRGGECLRGEEWPANGYCTAACSGDAECPTDARCVAMLDGAYRCAALCGDGRPGTGGCPEGLGLDVSCQNKTPLGGGPLVAVCAPR